MRKFVIGAIVVLFLLVGLFLFPLSETRTGEVTVPRLTTDWDNNGKTVPVNSKNNSLCGTVAVQKAEGVPPVVIGTFELVGPDWANASEADKQAASKTEINRIIDAHNAKVARYQSDASTWLIGSVSAQGEPHLPPGGGGSCCSWRNASGTFVIPGQSSQCLPCTWPVECAFYQYCCCGSSDPPICYSCFYTCGGACGA